MAAATHRRRATLMLADCGAEKVRNPASNRCVELTTATGRKLVEKFKNGEVEGFSPADREKMAAFVRRVRPTVAGRVHRRATIAPPSLPARRREHLETEQEEETKEDVPRRSMDDVPLAIRQRLAKWAQRFKNERRSDTHERPAVRAFCETNPDPTLLIPSVATYTSSMRLSYFIWKDPLQHLKANERWQPTPSFNPQTRKYEGKTMDIPQNSLLPRRTLRLYDPKIRVPITLDDIVPQAWFQQMNKFLFRLTNRERCILFAYSLNAHLQVNAFLTQGERFKWPKFYGWAWAATTNLDSRINPLFFALKDEMMRPTFAATLAEQGADAETVRHLDKIRTDHANDLAKLHRAVTKAMRDEMFPRSMMANAMRAFADELQAIILKSPPLPVDATFYRGTKDPYFVRRQGADAFRHPSFISCTVDPTHAMRYARGGRCCFQRIHAPKGSHILFVGGNTFYSQELEFVLPMQTVYANVQMSHPLGYFETNDGANVATWCDPPPSTVRYYVSDIVVQTPR